MTRISVISTSPFALLPTVFLKAKPAFWMFDRMCLFCDGSQRPCFLPNNKQPHLMHTDRDLNTGFFIAVLHPSISEIGFFDACKNIVYTIWCAQHFMTDKEFYASFVGSKKTRLSAIYYLEGYLEYVSNNCLLHFQKYSE